MEAACLLIEECLKERRKVLNLSRGNLSEAPKALEALAGQAVKRLDLSYNNLEYLPIEVGALTQLQELKLCCNNASTFTIPPVIGKLLSLVILKLSGNSLTQLPTEIGLLSSLKMLDVSNNALSTLPSSITLLQNISEIRADNNTLESFISFPENLTHLFLSYNPRATQLPGWFETIQGSRALRQLELRGCMISTFPLGISQLTALRILDFGDNNIASIPEGIFPYLTVLDKLFLDTNSLTKLPDDIGSLSLLSTLGLFGNRIEELPTSIKRLSNLQELQIDTNIIRKPPKEIIDKGCSAVRQFFESLADESAVSCYRIKLLVVGQENVGKTSLIRKLRSTQLKNPLRRAATLTRHFPQPSESNNSPPISTDGIDIEHLQFTPKGNTKQTVDFSIWDFAGQELYYTTHQFFLTGRSMFVVVFDLQQTYNQQTRVEFWLQSIALHAGRDVPVFLVGTHADSRMFRDDDAIAERLNSVALEFTSCSANIRLVTAVSCHLGTGIDELREMLVAEALKLKHMGEQIPSSYLRLEQAVEQIKEEKSRNKEPPMIAWSQYVALAETCRIHTTAALKVATAFLHDLGILLHYSFNDGISNLNDIVVVDPQWLIDMMAQIISTKHNFCKNGILKHSLLEQLWKAPLFPVHVHQQCLSLMRMFRISYEVDAETDMIPCLLPEEKPDTSVLWHYRDEESARYDRLWLFEFVPIGLFSHLLIQLKLSTTMHVIWRYGCVVSTEAGLAQVCEMPLRRSISISVRSRSGFSLMAMINGTLQQMLENFYPKASFKQLIPCTHCTENNQFDPWLFSTEECEAAILAQENFLQCQKNQCNIPLETLVPDLTLKLHEKFKINMELITMEPKPFGKGAFGVLYRGTYQNSTVAVKILGITQESSVMDEFRKEVTLMSELCHPNVVSLKGYSFEPGRIALVMEFMDKGDLYQLIRKKEPIPMNLILKLAFDIANGMNFCHSLSPPILHRDLKPPNIMLASDTQWGYAAKVGDFGASVKQYISSLNERAVETPIWVAPEILAGGRYTTKSDVYSFAVTLFELVEQKDPFHDIEFRFLLQLEEAIISGRRSSLKNVELKSPGLANLIEDCWHPNPAHRPSCKEILDRLLELMSFDKELVNFCRSQIALHVPKFNSSKEEPETQVHGRFIKRLNTKPSASVCQLLLVGSEIWSSHKNGDLVIWHSDTGRFFRRILAAHSKEILSMALIGKRVWSGSRDGFIRIWKSLALDNSPLVNSTELAKEGTLEMSGQTGSTIHVQLYHGSSEFIEGVSLVGSRVAPIQESNKCAFSISTTNKGQFVFYCSSISERDDWVKTIAIVSRNLSDETMDLFIHQISPRSRRDEISTILYINELAFVAVKDLTIRVYNPSTYECVKEIQVTEAAWISAARPVGGSRRVFQRRLTDSGSTRPNSSLRSSAEAGQESVSSKESPRSDSPQITCLSDLSQNLCVISKLKSHGGYVWAIIHNIVFRLHHQEFRTTGKLIGHTKGVNDVEGLGDFLWSCSMDISVRVWSIHNLSCIKVINFSSVPFSLKTVGSKMWIGDEKSICIYDSSDYSQTKHISFIHTDVVCSMVVVWRRIVWSASNDDSICLWS